MHATAKTSPLVVPAVRRYIIDGAASDARFWVRKFGLLTVEGNFGHSVAGRIAVEDAHLSACGVVDLSALTTGERGRDHHPITVRKRDAHLRSDDFFAAERYPEIALTADAVPLSQTAVTATATVTIKGATRPLLVTVRVLDPTARDGDGLLLEIDGELDRHEFGIAPASFFYDKVVVARRVRFKLRIAARAQAA